MNELSGRLHAVEKSVAEHVAECRERRREHEKMEARLDQEIRSLRKADVALTREIQNIRIKLASIVGVVAMLGSIAGSFLARYLAG